MAVMQNTTVLFTTRIGEKQILNLVHLHLWAGVESFGEYSLA
jgi:hypothetical protein